MSHKSTDIPDTGAPAVDDLGELDSLVSDLVGEINQAAEEISRVMTSTDETPPSIEAGAALSDDGELAGHESPEASNVDDDHDPIAEAAQDIERALADAGASADLSALADPVEEPVAVEDEAAAPTPVPEDAIDAPSDDAPVDEAPDAPDASDATSADAETPVERSLDDELAAVAAELGADLDSAFARDPEPVDAADEPTDERDDASSPAPGASDDQGADALAAQIDEELSRALDERADDVDDAEPTSAAVAEQPEADAATETEDDLPPADARATDEAVHAVAEAIDRLLDEETADAADKVEDAVAAPEDDATTVADDDEQVEDDEDEPEATPVAAPAPAPAPVAKPTPAKKKPAPDDDTDSSRRRFNPLRVAMGVLVLVNRPLERLSPSLRDTLGFAGLVTLFNAACLWVFLLLR